MFPMLTVLFSLREYSMEKDWFPVWVSAPGFTSQDIEALAAERDEGDVIVVPPAVMLFMKSEYRKVYVVLFSRTVKELFEIGVPLYGTVKWEIIVFPQAKVSVKGR